MKAERLNECPVHAGTEVPPEVEYLLWMPADVRFGGDEITEDINRDIIVAYRLGKQSNG